MKILLLLAFIWQVRTLTSAHFDKKNTRFYNLTKERYFIDKTHFLSDFLLNLNKTKHLYFFTVPHKFGKTINAEMIKTFADIELDENKERKNPNDTQAYEIFSKLSIGKNEKIMKDHLANHPVILFDLQLECGKSWESFFSSIQSYVKMMFLEYKFIHDLHKKCENSTAHFLLMDKVFNSELNQNETSHSLKALINVVGDFFNADVILLIDHYDFFVDRHFSHSPQDIDRIYELINGMIFHIFDEDVPLRKGFMFGVSGLMFPTPLKHLRNISQFPFLGYYSAKYFGFTEIELSSLCEEYKFSPEDAIKMRNMLGEYISFERFKLYNPFSVVEFVNNVEDDNLTRFEIIQRKYCNQKDRTKLISSFMKSAEFRQTAIFLLRHNRCNVVVINVFFESKNVFQIVENLKLNGSLSSYNKAVLPAYFFEQGFIVSVYEENNLFMIPNLEADLDLRSRLKLFYMESKNMFIILQLLHVLKEIILCPSNASVEIRQNLNRTMSELFEGLKQSKQDNFNDLDLMGIIYAFAPDIDLWVFSEPIHNKIALLEYKNEHVMSDGEILKQLTSITSYSGSSALKNIRWYKSLSEMK